MTREEVRQLSGCELVRVYASNGQDRASPSFRWDIGQVVGVNVWSVDFPLIIVLFEAMQPGHTTRVQEVSADLCELVSPLRGAP